MMVIVMEVCITHTHTYIYIYYIYVYLFYLYLYKNYILLDILCVYIYIIEESSPSVSNTRDHVTRDEYSVKNSSSSSSAPPPSSKGGSSGKYGLGNPGVKAGI